jgi:glycerophosphoryl diester phosphodiesterase
MNFLHKLENGLLKLIDGFYSIRPQPSPSREVLSSCKIISHRGEHDGKNVFENTIAAFDRAQEKGVWGIECDLRWTKDLQAVVIHDPDLLRVFGLNLKVCDVSLAELKATCDRVPTLEDVIRRYGKQLHLMLEIKEEVYPDPVHQNRLLAELFSTLLPREDFHILTLSPKMFQVIDFVPPSTFLPIARLNFLKLSELARSETYRGLCGHYLFLTNRLIKQHHDLHQKVGTGYIGSKNCLFRELNRGVEWIFSNNAAELQKNIRQLERLSE